MAEIYQDMMFIYSIYLSLHQYMSVIYIYIMSKWSFNIIQIHLLWRYFYRFLRQNPERLPEQAAELERVVRSLQPAA